MACAPALIASQTPADLSGLWSALLESAGRLHPLALHFPLGLVLAAALVELWRGIQRRPGLSDFTPIALWLAAAFAWVAAGTGWLFAENQGGGDDLFWHRWLGIAAAIALVPLAWSASRAVRPGDASGRQMATLVRGGVIGLAVLVAWVGHLGGAMTWGDNFAIKPILEWKRGGVPAVANAANAANGTAGSAAAAAPSGVASSSATTAGAGAAGAAVAAGTAGSAASGAAPAGAASAAPHSAAHQASAELYARAVLPLLQERCYECHGNGKHKGGLAMDDAASLLAQNKEGAWIVKAGDAAASLVLQRVQLPVDDDDAMPPEGDRLTADQVLALKQWIDGGAIMAAPAVAAGAPTSGARASAPFGAPPAPSSLPVKPAPQASAEVNAAMAAFRARGVLVQPVSQRDGWVEFNASARGKAFTDADLAGLAVLAPFIVELNLARTSVTDAGLQSLPQLPELVALRLDSTAATDAGVLAALGSAPQVQVVNLVSTGVTDATARKLGDMQRLSRVYLWNTSISAEALKALRTARPSAQVDAGER